MATSAEDVETRLIFRTRWMPLASCRSAGPAGDGEQAMRATCAWRCHALDAARRTNAPRRSASDMCGGAERESNREKRGGRRARFRERRKAFRDEPGCHHWCASLHRKAKMLACVFRVTGALSTNARRPRWRCASRWRRLARCIHRTVDSAPLATAARRRAAPRRNASPRTLCKWRVLIGREERSSSERREREPNFRFLTF